MEGYAVDAARHMQSTAVRLLDAEKTTDGMPAKKLAVDHALRAEGARDVKNAVTMARILPEIQARLTDFDANPNLLSVANGVLDLQTFTLQPHDPAARLTRLLPVAYEPNAQAPQWDRFLLA